MESKTYGSLIHFMKNQNDAFITYLIDQKNKNQKPISSSNSCLSKYITATQKLFSQIKINEQNLWIIPLISVSKVRVYFSGNQYHLNNYIDPQTYPASNCCKKCIYIDIQSNLNGSIICPQCKLILIDFVYYRQDDRKSIQTAHQLTEIQKQKLFQQKRKHNLFKSRMLSENLTSHKFKTRNLKRMIQTYQTSVQQISINGLAQKKNKQNNNNNTKNQQALITKDGFILQLKHFISNNKKCKINSILKKDFNEFKEYETKNNCYQQNNQDIKNNKQQQIQQTKKIILDIFNFSI